MSEYALAVDIGGTFTDVVLREAGRRFWVDKTLTTPGDLREGFFRAIDGVLSKAGLIPADVNDVIVHATTVVTNAILERKGALTAAVFTEGFRDILALRDECRSNIYDNQIEVPSPLIDADHTFTIRERTLSDGTVVTTVDEAEVRALARDLSRRSISSVAVCLMSAYRNETNERRVRDLLLDEAPGLYVSISSEVSPLMGEYARASTTALNAYTVPVVRPYFTSLGSKLRDHGFSQDLLVMLSSGGVISEIGRAHV